MNKLEPKEISKKFFFETNLSETPSLDELTRVFVIAAKKYLNNEIDSYSFSAISGAIYDDYVIRTNLLQTIFAGIVESASEINFYKENLQTYKNPITSDQQIALDHSMSTIARIESEIKNFLLSVQ